MVLTSELRANECFLFKVEETASSTSPIKLSSFNAVSGRQNTKVYLSITASDTSREDCFAWCNKKCIGQLI